MNLGREKVILQLFLSCLGLARVNAQSYTNFTGHIGGAGGQIVVNWDQTAGVLEQADTPLGPWSRSERR